MGDAADIGRLLHDFNTEFDTPSPGADVSSERLAALLAGDSMFAIIVGSPAVAIALVSARSVDPVVTGTGSANQTELGPPRTDTRRQPAEAIGGHDGSTSMLRETGRVRMQLLDPAGFDNSAADYEHIEVFPLAAAMGAEIRDVEVAALSDAAFDEVRHALFRHKMIFFRDQALDHAGHEAFTARLGEFGEDAYTKGLPGHEHIQPVIKEADSSVRMIFGTGWHTDSAFLERPPSISTLMAEEVPPYGGDTIWANAALAYRMLSERMREMIDGLQVRMSRGDVMRTQALAAGSASATLSLQDSEETLARHVEGTLHPIVRTHPVTGERALYVDQTYSCGIDGLTDEEAMPLLEFLVGHVTRSAFTCRLRWEAGTLALWDNRICVHQAYNDHVGHRRVMYRTTVQGERPT